MNKVDKYGLSKQSVDLYLNSWRPNTRKQYAVYAKKWNTICILKGWNKENPSLNQGIWFLTDLFNKGLSYSAINIARSTLSLLLPQYEGYDFDKHPVVCRVLKGIYNKRPQRSRYAATWDVDIVLTYLSELFPLNRLTLRELTTKLVLLMLLTSCQRVQTLSSLRLSDLIWSADNLTAVFRLSNVLKHNKRGSLGVLTFHSFNSDPRICVVKTLKEYIVRTNGLREVRDKHVDELFIITTPPFSVASKATIARWTKETLAKAGIDTNLFKAHSIRGASTSKLNSLHVSVTEIMQKASWKCESTFQKFYNKTLMPKDVSHKVLSNFLNRKN